MSNANTQSQHTGIFVLLMAMVFSISPFAIDMYLPALPTMAVYFGSSIDAMEASVAVYLFTFALGQFFFGAIADSLDKSKILLGGLLGFAVASVFVGLSETQTSLYIWRAMQAFSSGTSVVVFALVQQKYGSNTVGVAGQSSQIISYILSVVVIAPMIAPLIGSQILVNFSWSMIFYLLAAYALIAVVITQNFQLRSNKILPESEHKPLHLGRIIKGYKQIFSNSTTLAYIFAGGFSFAGLFAFVSGSPFVYMEYFHATPEQFGWLVALNAVAMVSMNLLNAKLFGHIDPTKKLIAGGFLLAITSVYLFLVAFFDLGLAFVVAGVVVYVGSLGLTAANAIAGALASAKEYTGMVSGINGILQFGLGAVASSIVSISASTTAMTMNITMAMCGVTSFVFALVLLFKLNSSGDLTTDKQQALFNSEGMPL